MGGTGGGIAHLTHLGGLVFGFFYMAYPMIRQKIRREYYKRKWSQRGPERQKLLSLMHKDSTVFTDRMS